MKGQAALEFLMTYGWAILILVAVVAVILTSGVLSADYLISEECTFGNSVPCNFALFNEGNETKISIRVFNGFPYKINITSFDVQTKDGSRSFSGFRSGIVLESGENYTLEGTLGSPELTPNTMKRFSGSLTYVSCAPEIDPTGCSTSAHTLSGRVVGKVIPE